MKPAGASVFALSVIISVGASPSFADFIPWKYEWTPDAQVVVADGSGTSGLTFSKESATLSGGGTFDLVATSLRVFSSAPPSHPDTFTNRHYTLSLLLTIAGVPQRTLQFGGVLNGTLSTGGANLTNTFTGDVQQSFAPRGGFIGMTVTIGPFIAPTDVNGQAAGSVGATIFAIGEGPPPGNNNAPEPSTLALAVMGVLTIGGAAYRKILHRRQQAGSVSR